MRPLSTPPYLSIVVPLRNEEDNLPFLVAATKQALSSMDSWELVLVDDGSSDATAPLCRSIATGDPRIRFIRLARPYGQAVATQAGFDHTWGDVIVTMDGDLQNDPRDIPRLTAKLEEGFDLVAGFRVPRRDSFFSRVVPSRMANILIRWTTGIDVRDNGCSLRAYRRTMIARMRLYSDFHRFLPAFAVGVTAARVAELPVNHYPRFTGKTKYGIGRVPKVINDLLILKLIQSFHGHPLLMFGPPSLAAGLGAAALLAQSARLWANADIGVLAEQGFVLTSIAAILFALALYLGMLGLLAEVTLSEQFPSGNQRRTILRGRTRRHPASTEEARQ